MTLDASYFDRLYAASHDPWSFATRPYEARKYALTLASLPRQRYERVFEPGCSIGVLTAMLATRASHVVASDASAAALERARTRCPGNVELLHAAVPRSWPEGTFDLIVCSELGYYLDASDLGWFIRRCGQSVRPGGHLVAVHWRAKVPDYPSDAAEVHRRFRETPPWQPLAHYEDAHFLLDVFGSGATAALTGPEE